MKYLLSIFTALGFFLAGGCDQKEDHLLDTDEESIEQQEEYRQDDFRDESNFPIGPGPDTGIIPDNFRRDD